MGFVKLPWYSCYTKAKTLASKWRLLVSLASSDSLHWEGDSPQNITAKSAKWPEIKMIWVWFICIKKHKLGFPIRSFPIHSLFTDQLFCWGNWVEKCGELIPCGKRSRWNSRRAWADPLTSENSHCTSYLYSLRWCLFFVLLRRSIAHSIAKKCTDTVVSSPKI